MDESTKATVEKFQAKLAILEGQARKIKLSINGLYELEGEVPLYPDVESDTPTAFSSSTSIRPDQFFGRPMATVVREILAARNQRQLGAISLDDLYSVLMQGGFVLEGKDEVAKKRTLAITIGKNPAFARVPNTGHVGLAEWYPNHKRKESKGSEDSEKEDETPAPPQAPPVQGPTTQLTMKDAPESLK